MVQVNLDVSVDVVEEGVKVSGRDLVVIGETFPIAMQEFAFKFAENLQKQWLDTLCPNTALVVEKKEKDCV